MARRILLTIEYDGTAYSGWQRQYNGLAVQQLIEEALTARQARQSPSQAQAGRTRAYTPWDSARISTPPPAFRRKSTRSC